MIKSQSNIARSAAMASHLAASQHAMIHDMLVDGSLKVAQLAAVAGSSDRSIRRSRSLHHLVTYPWRAGTPDIEYLTGVLPTASLLTLLTYYSTSLSIATIHSIWLFRSFNPSTMRHWVQKID